MSEKQTDWFRNETDDYFQVGDRVIWHGDDEMTGTLTLITEEKFGVKWDDGQYIEYSSEHQDAIQKY